ncbi:MAG: hypothetical protein GQ525_09755 [Draconibacterium sp.]|nr:hypothetical protein [Draconibacterium sp.]
MEKVACIFIYSTQRIFNLDMQQKVAVDFSGSATTHIQLLKPLKTQW